jgi:hypothetical protein
MVDALDLSNIAAVNAAAFWKSRGISDKYKARILANEILMKTNLDADTTSGIVGAYVMYQADEGRQYHSSHLERILENMIRNSDVTLRLSTKVSGIEKLDSTGWVLTSKSTTDDRSAEIETFDTVIFAAPLSNTTVNLQNTTFQDLPLPEYQSVKIRWFAFPSTAKSPLDIVAGHATSARSVQRTINYSNAIEIRHIGPIAGKSLDDSGQLQLYRITSTRLLQEKEIAALLDGTIPQFIAEYGAHDAQPVILPANNFPPFKLDDRFWYPNAIEAVLSSVEISAWAGENVARLAALDLRTRS